MKKLYKRRRVWVYSDEREPRQVLDYSYEYDRRGQEFLRIVKETKNGSLNLAILTEHDVTDVKYGFGTPETA